MTGYKFNDADKTINDMLEIESIPLLASYTHGFPELRKGRSTLSNISKIERWYENEIKNPIKQRKRNWHRIAALPAIIGIHSIDDVPKKYQGVLNEIIDKRLKNTDNEDQIVQMTLQSLVSKLSISQDYIIDTNIIESIIKIINDFHEYKNPICFINSYIATEFLIAYLKRNDLAPIQQKKSIRTCFDSISNSNDTGMIFHSKLIDSYHGTSIFPQVSEVVLSFPKRMERFNNYLNHWVLSTLAVLKYMQLVLKSGAWSSDEIDFRMKKMCSIYFRERGISIAEVEQLMNYAPNKDKEFHNFMKNEFISVSELYSHSTLIEPNQEYYMKRWIPFSDVYPRNYFERIVNRRNIFDLTSKTLKSFVKSSNFLFPTILAIELLSDCRIIREWIYDKGKDPSKDLDDIDEKQVEKTIEKYINEENNKIENDDDLADYCNEIDRQ